ncbi:hypothetical protein [Halobaculum roseum]|uniref:Integral membrane protein n=1 Tax=Halobaculum roseum TaxID=2175149 RepID=A0ABD5MHK0_9EURY|nr:hypothetical protein [Halobaculum roseum]QZY02976.1 hypothetical protein K6T36_01935 [Halobaculum roseum]
MSEPPAPSTLRTRVRESPLIAVSGGLALVVLVGAVAVLVTLVGPGRIPDPGGRRLGAAILAAMVVVALLWLSVVARAVAGVVAYADAGARPTGIPLALAVVEGAIAVAMLAVASVVVALGGPGPEPEVYAIAAYAVTAIGVGLAPVSLARAGVALSGDF